MYELCSNATHLCLRDWWLLLWIYKCTLFTSYHTIVCKIWDVNLDTTSKHVCIYDWEKIGWVGITFILRKSWRFSHNDPHFVMTLYKSKTSWVSSKNKDIPWQVNYSLSIKCGKSIEARVGKKERIPLANYEETTCRFQHSQLCMCVYIDCFSYYTQFSTGSALTLHLHMKWGVDNCSLPLLMIGQKSFQVFSHKHGELDWGSNLWQSVQPIHSTLSIFF